MIIVLTGENSFGLGQVLKKLVNDFVVNNGNLTIERLDGEETEFSNVQQLLTSLPFLAARQLVILREPSKNKQFVEQFEQLLSTLPDTTDVIIIEPKLDKRLSYYKFLKKNTDFREFPELDNSGLSHWLVTTAKERSGTISHTDALYLVDRVGTNQQRIASELNKLLLYDLHITRQSIDLLTDPTPQSTIFQLLEVAFKGFASETLNLYAQQRALKVEPQQIIAMLSWQLHVVSVIKTAGDLSTDQIAQEAGINPYVIRKSQSIASQLSLIDLKKRVSDLEIIDKRLKKTMIDPDEALQHYLLSLKT